MPDVDPELEVTYWLGALLEVGVASGFIVCLGLLNAPEQGVAVLTQQAQRHAATLLLTAVRRV
jgi:hypothetical protein